MFKLWKTVAALTVLLLIIFNCYGSDALLNRPTYNYKILLPQIPLQSLNYINIANYNVRTSHQDKETENSWHHRKEYFFNVICSEDDSYQVMEKMRIKLEISISQYLESFKSDQSDQIQLDHCTTCKYAFQEPFPIYETKYFRISLKSSFDANGKLYGNFPYPYRLIIALKRHSSRPNETEWEDLRKILTVLETNVCSDIGANYTSYGVFQDEYFRKKDVNEVIPSEPHYFLHFIFRFPHGSKVNDINFQDPNPFDHFKLHHPNYIQENKLKPDSQFIYKRSPDIITTQELTFEQLQDFKNRLSNHKLIGYSAHQGLSLESVKADTWIGELVAIAYREDRFKCLDSGVRWLTSDTPHLPSKAKGASRHRIIVWGKFQDILTGHNFFVFNTHYDHMCQDQKESVDAEKAIINNIAKNEVWFAVGERFYQSVDGQSLYHYYQKAVNCKDVRDASLLGHFGEAGSWGGFENDPFMAPFKNNNFTCDTLDVGFTNNKDMTVLFTYSINGAYDPNLKSCYSIGETLSSSYRLASDHFMTGFYVLLKSTPTSLE